MTQFVKEMNNSRVTLHLIDRDNHDPVGYKDITFHLIFNVRIDLNRKDRYMEGGNLTNPPSSMTYASVISR